jgi:hypothetical protein
MHFENEIYWSSFGSNSTQNWNLGFSSWKKIPIPILEVKPNPT